LYRTSAIYRRWQLPAAASANSIGDLIGLRLRLLEQGEARLELDHSGRPDLLELEIERRDRRIWQRGEALGGLDRAIEVCLERIIEPKAEPLEALALGDAAVIAPFGVFIGSAEAPWHAALAMLADECAAGSVWIALMRDSELAHAASLAPLRYIVTSA
jgi:hypothetical protein